MIYVQGGTKAQKMYAYSMAEFVCNKFDINPDIEISFRRLTNDRSLGGCVCVDKGEYEIDIKRRRTGCNFLFLVLVVIKIFHPVRH